MDIYRCPNCHETIIVYDDEIFCPVCLRAYLVIDEELIEQTVNLCERSL